MYKQLKEQFKAMRSKKGLHQIFTKKSGRNHLNFKCKISLQIFDNKHKNRQFNSQIFSEVCRACNIRCTDVVTNQF